MSRKSRSTMAPQAIETTPILTPRALTRQEFGRRLQQLMLAKSWNQSDLARAADLGRDSISTYVNGKTFPTPVALKKMADALGMEPQELLPNTMMNAMDDEHPAVELRQAAGHPGKAWLRVNRAVSFGTAAKIVELINQDDERE
jgi:transcriptional regulator with XRE-family HTH domain